MSLEQEVIEEAPVITEEVKAEAEPAAEAPEEAKQEPQESMADYAAELEASLKQGPPEDDPVWARFEELLESKEIIPIKIDSVVKGGVIAFVDEIRAFIPASKLANRYVENLEDYKGKETEAIVITAEKAGKRLVLSVKDALNKRRDEKRAAKEAERAEKLAECVEGTVLEGTVDSIMDYGAFIKLDNGLSGLLHVSQISYNRVKSPADVLNKGDRLTVKVIGIKDGKISLSKKALEEAPARPARERRERREGDRPERSDRGPRGERREREEVFNYKETRKATTSLGDLLSDIKLN